MDFIKDILQAYKGRLFWKNIVRKYNINENKYVIILPKIRTKENYYALLFLEQFLKEKKAESAIIITIDNSIKEMVKYFTHKVEAVYVVNNNKLNQLIKFYCLYKFTDRLIIASLKEPYGQNGSGLINKKGLKYKDVFGKIVYNISDISSVKKPKYIKNKNELLKFFNRKRLEN